MPPSTWWIRDLSSFSIEGQSWGVSFIAFTISLSFSCFSNLLAESEANIEDAAASACLVAIAPPLHKAAPAWPPSWLQMHF